MIIARQICKRYQESLFLEKPNIIDMKKSFYFILFVFSFYYLSSCSTYDYNLEMMGKAVQDHLRYRDADKGTITKITYLKALSYDEIPEDKREKEDEVYLCKVYMQGTWSYYNSYRIFNINDTIDCFFSKNMTFLRLGNFKEQ